MSTSTFSITRHSQSPILPCAPTPGGTLPLSWIDRYPTHRGLVDSLHVFRDGREPGKVIREAVAKVLVYYYPLAGRLVESSEGEAEVACTGEGVWFVEASANCSLEEIKYLERPLMIPHEDLLPGSHPVVAPADTIVMMQVTDFTCGGFVVGLKFNHATADGLGASMFINSVSQLSKGLPEPTIKPIWGRESFPNPTNLTPAPLPNLPVTNLQYFAMDISLHTITNLKTRFTAQTGLTCSTFDLVVAKIWQSRTRALNLNPAAELRLCFFASTRHLLNLGEGYYGNCIFPVKVTSTCNEIVEATLYEVVGLIKEAKGRMVQEFATWAKGESESDPFELRVSYEETLFVSDWSRLGFDEVDYGWGKPVYAGPVTNNDYIASCIIMKSSGPKEGTRLVTRCVEKEHLEAFNKAMKDLV